MDKSSIIEKINNFLVEDFEVEAEKIQPQANLRDTLGLDSLDYIDLVVVIESNFGFKVKPEDFIAIVTFEDFYSYVEKRVSEKVTSDHA
jgi:acyl carrier protein